MQVNMKAGDTQSNLELNESVFDVPFNSDLVHQVVTAYMAKSRAGTKAQKTRSEVSGGGSKPWRQKGTGRARAGTIRSPIWRKGGVTFAAKPRSYEQKVNKKVYKKAISCILSELLKNEALTFVSELSFESTKTKDFVSFLDKASLPSENVLLITDAVSESQYLASRNLPTVEVIDAYEVDPYLLLKYENVVLTEKAAKLLEEALS